MRHKWQLPLTSFYSTLKLQCIFAKTAALYQPIAGSVAGKEENLVSFQINAIIASPQKKP